MKSVIMALDQGTSSSRTLLFSGSGEILATAAEPVESFYPKPGWVEQDAECIWESQKRTMDAALQLAGLSFKDVTAIGITNQRETVVAWNKKTGKALAKAIVWQCRRTAEYCAQLKQSGLEPMIRSKTGLLLDPYFSATKMRWLLQNNPSVKQAAKKGELCFGTIDSWLIWKLTGGKTHATEPSNASRTMLFNILEMQWDSELLDVFSIDPKSLPEVKPSMGFIGQTCGFTFGAEVPITGVLGDQQAALFGQTCFEPGMVKNTYGTGCFLLANTGKKPVFSNQALLTTIAWQIGKETTYALEGSVFTGGSLIQWLRDSLNLFQNADETEAMAIKAEHNENLYLVPAFTGLGAPHWDPYARGILIGLTAKTDKNHIIRAALESIAYQSFDLIRAMETDMKQKLQILRVDGGASKNNFLCQFQANLLECVVSRPASVESTALGAAFIAGLGIGVFKDMNQVKALWKEDRVFKPNLSQQQIQPLLNQWHEALKRAKNWQP